MKITHYHFAFFLLLLFAIGCGGNVTVTGKVTFPDGSPLDHGEVIFETETSVSRGPINSDGTYSMFTGENMGVPKGTYKVSIGGFKPTVIAPPPALDADGRPMMGGPPQVSVIPPVFPVARALLNGETSGIVAEIKGRTVFDIAVRRPD